MKIYNITDFDLITPIWVNKLTGSVFYQFKDIIVKVNPKFYNNKWATGLMAISETIKIPALKGIVLGSMGEVGYVTDYIDGEDLQEDKPFNYRHDKVRAKKINDTTTIKIVELLKKILIGAIGSGYLICDVTKRNILVKDNEAYLVDFDIIEEIKDGMLTNQSYIQIYQELLDYLKIKHVFYGDIKQLLDRL